MMAPFTTEKTQETTHSHTHTHTHTHTPRVWCWRRHSKESASLRSSTTGTEWGETSETGTKKGETLTAQTVFYSILTVIEVVKHRCISVGILSMLSAPYNNIYDPVSGENKWFTLMYWLISIVNYLKYCCFPLFSHVINSCIGLLKPNLSESNKSKSRNSQHILNNHVFCLVL